MFGGMNRSLPGRERSKDSLGRGNSINKGSEAERFWPGALKFLLAGVAAGVGECRRVESVGWQGALEGVLSP